MQEIVLKKQLPVINMNFDELKASLEETMDKYRGIVVTEEGLRDCKATQKELAGIRRKIDDYRKDVKREMLKPVSDFEDMCKDLISLIDSTEKPIKDGIKIFDDKRREEKKEIALKLIQESVQAHGLNEKYANRLNVLDKYTTLTAKPSIIKSDIEQRVFLLLQEQIKENETIEIIKSTIENANTSIKTPLELSDFQNLINMNFPVNKIIEEINKRAALIRKAEELKPTEEPKEENRITSEQIDPTTEINKDELLYFVDIKVTASRDKIAQLSNFLKANGYEYTVKDKGRL